MQLQLSEHFTYPNTLRSQRVRITEVLLYFIAVINVHLIMYIITRTNDMRVRTVKLNLAFYSGMLEIRHGLHDARSYPHLYLVLKDPHEGSLSFLFFLLALVSVLCNHLHSLGQPQSSVPHAKRSSSRFAFLFIYLLALVLWCPCTL